MVRKWVHFRDVGGSCPICGQPVHVGLSMSTGEFFWVHDKVSDYYSIHIKHEIEMDGDVCRLAPIEFKEGMELVRGHKASAARRSRHVKCVETGEVFPSIKSAADSVGVKGPTISQALKKGCRAGGMHWEYV